jgi:aryl-alcohol dehydrogenase-like predicted oxidoreductase
MQFGWTADERTSGEIMKEAVDSGCNFFDTADVYSSWYSGNRGGESETIIGRWLTQEYVRRDSLVIATKVRGRMGSGPNDEGLSRYHILNSVDQSLRRLQTDYIDLYQVHFPDDETPLEETLTALNDLVQSGKVRYVGCSNFPAWLLAKSLWISDIRSLCRFDSLQPHYNYIHRAEFERELEPLCDDQGVGVIPYSPLAAGFLTGKYRSRSKMPNSSRVGRVKELYLNEAGFKALDELERVGQSAGATVAQTAIAWVLAKRTVCSAIIGANNIQQFKETIEGANVQLSIDQVAILDDATAWQ